MNVGWYGVIGCVAIAVLAGIAEWRRRHRRNPDRVGPISWTTVQVLALIAAAAIGAFITHK